MTLISRSSNISNFISSHSQVFSRFDLLKNYAKPPLLECVFNKVAGIQCQSVTLIKKETSAQVFSSEFCEIFKNTFLIKQLRATASVILALVICDFQFILHFSSTFVTFQIIYQTQ